MQLVLLLVLLDKACTGQQAHVQGSADDVVDGGNGLGNACRFGGAHDGDDAPVDGASAAGKTSP